MSADTSAASRRVSSCRTALECDRLLSFLFVSIFLSFFLRSISLQAENGDQIRGALRGRMANSLMGVRLRLTRLIANGSEITIPLMSRCPCVQQKWPSRGFLRANVYQVIQFPLRDEFSFQSMFATTRMRKSGPEPLITLERAYLEALSTAKRWRPSLNGAVMAGENALTIFEFTAIR